MPAPDSLLQSVTLASALACQNRGPLPLRRVLALLLVG